MNDNNESRYTSPQLYSPYSTMKIQYNYSTINIHEVLTV